MARPQVKQRSNLSKQAMALAEELGRITGTLEGTAKAWVNSPTLAARLARVRDGAAEMLDKLRKGTRRGRRTASRRGNKARMAPDPARAPGKRRRKPAPTLKGIRKSDQRIPKMRTAKAVRQRRKSYA